MSGVQTRPCLDQIGPGLGQLLRPAIRLHLTRFHPKLNGGNLVRDALAERRKDQVVLPPARSRPCVVLIHQKNPSCA